MGYFDIVKSIPGNTHYYPLHHNANDAVTSNSLHGKNYGAEFNGTHAVFSGNDYIELPLSRDFSATQTGKLSIAIHLTITDWRGKSGTGSSAGEYIHWLGKGIPGKHEWTFRHYIKGSKAGQAPQRQGRLSFYAFNPLGSLGAGSFHQDPSMPTTERVIVATLDRTYTTLYVNGKQIAKNLLSDYNIRQSWAGSPVRFGTRDLTTGFLIGKMRRVAFYNRILTPAEVLKLS